MSRYTDVDAMLNSLPNEPYKGTLRRILMQAPTADVAPVVHARWDEDHKCTHCGVDAVHHDIDGETVVYYPTRCCPNCGAKMVGEVSE